MKCEFTTASISIIILIIWMNWGHSFPYVQRLLHGERSAIYGTIATIDGALLGFVIATLAIILGFAPSNRFTVLRESAHYNDLWLTLRSTIRILALATVAALVALIIDRDSAPNTPSMVSCFAFSLLAAFRVARSIWVLEGVTKLITKQPVSKTV